MHRNSEFTRHSGEFALPARTCWSRNKYSKGRRDRIQSRKGRGVNFFKSDIMGSRSLRMAAIALAGTFFVSLPASAQLSWGDQSSKCSGTTKVDYARLYGLTLWDNWPAKCNATNGTGSLPHGKPTRCVDKASLGMWGEWDTPNAAACKPKEPHWGTVTAYGCTARSEGKRIYASRIWDATGNVKSVCEHTPAKFNDKYGVSHSYTGGESCAGRGIGEMWAEWRVDDPECGFNHWGVPKADHCTGKNTRQWSSVLYDIPDGEDHWEACGKSPIKFDGKDAYPISCVEDPTTKEMWGEWEREDTTCTGSRWDTPKADYCVAAGKRQYSSILRDIPSGEAWEIACRETSGTIHGQAFGRPNRCILDVSMWGEFDVDDPSCTGDERTAAQRADDEKAEALDKRIEEAAELGNYHQAILAVTKPDNAQGLLKQVLESDAAKNGGYDTATFMISSGGSFVVGYDHAEGLSMTRKSDGTFACAPMWANSFTAGAQAGAGSSGILALSKGGFNGLKGESNGFVMGGSVGPAGYTSSFSWNYGNATGDPDMIAYQPGVGAGFEVQVAYNHTWTGVTREFACNPS